jgi:hypothetical protein
VGDIDARSGTTNACVRVGREDALPSVGDSGRGTSLARGVPVAVQNESGDVDSCSISFVCPSCAKADEDVGMVMGMEGEDDILWSVESLPAKVLPL